MHWGSPDKKQLSASPGAATGPEDFKIKGKVWGHQPNPGMPAAGLKAPLQFGIRIIQRESLGFEITYEAS